MTKPRFTFKKAAEALLIIWVFLITIDTGQTAYALMLYPSQFTETNPLGFPLGSIFVLSIWMVLCGLVEFQPKTRSYVLIATIVLSVNTIGAIIHNFVVLIG